MAEALGIVAGGVGIASFSIQIVGQVSQIRSFLSSMKTAPQELTDLIDEISLLNDILLSINMDEALASRCHQWCLKAAALMQEALDDCQEKMKKPGFRARLGFVIKKEDINKTIQKVERAKSMLNLAHLALVVQQSRRATTAQVKEPASAEISQKKVTKKASSPRARKSGNLLFKVSLPTWLSGKVWEIYSLNAQNQWTVSLKTRIVLPNNSLIFEYIKNKDTENWRRLLQETPSLIYSEDENGMTLLETAAIHLNLEGASWILEKGEIDPSIVWKTLYRLLIIIRVETPKDLQEIARLEELLIMNSQNKLAELNFDCYRDLWTCFATSPRGQQQIVDEIYTSSHEISEALRFDVCERFLQNVAFSLPFFLVDNVFSFLGSFETGYWKDRLPFILSYCMPICLASQQEYMDKIRKIFVDLVRNDANFNICRKFWPSTHPLTPMLIFLSSTQAILSAYQYFRGRKIIHGFKKSEISSFLHAWAEELVNAGVDLVAYGEREKSLLAKGSVKRCLPNYNYYPGVVEAPHVRLISFTYGPRPEDWHAYFSNWRDEFAGEFWHMIEHPELQMPGAWTYKRLPWPPCDDCLYCGCIV